MCMGYYFYDIYIYIWWIPILVRTYSSQRRESTTLSPLCSLTSGSSKSPKTQWGGWQVANSSSSFLGSVFPAAWCLAVTIQSGLAQLRGSLPHDLDSHGTSPQEIKPHYGIINRHDPFFVFFWVAFILFGRLFLRGFGVALGPLHKNPSVKLVIQWEFQLVNFNLLIMYWW